MRDSGESLHAVGYWRDSSSRRTGVDPTRLVDPTWAGGERHLLVGYLKAGHVWTAYFGVSYCRFQCGIPNDEMGSVDLTDGSWVWPEGLAHYVESHDICLPDELLAHARRNEFSVPRAPFGGESDESDPLDHHCVSDRHGEGVDRVGRA